MFGYICSLLIASVHLLLKLEGSVSNAKEIRNTLTDLLWDRLCYFP